MHTADSVNAQVAEIVRRAAAPVGDGERIGHLIQRASRRLRLPTGLTKRLWYQEQRTVPAHVALNLLAFDREAAELRDRMAALQDELDALADRR